MLKNRFLKAKKAKKRQNDGNLVLKYEKSRLEKQKNGLNQDLEIRKSFKKALLGLENRDFGENNFEISEIISIFSGLSEKSEKIFREYKMNEVIYGVSEAILQIKIAPWGPEITKNPDFCLEDFQNLKIFWEK